MDSYTITIAPNDDSGAATRLVVDTSGDQVRITDVHLHAPQGLSSGHIPTVDFDLLLQAVTGTVTASNGQRVPGPTELSAPHRTPALEAAAATEPAEQSAAPAAPQGRTRKATPRPATTLAPRPARTRTAKATSAEESSTPRRSKRDATTSTARTAKRAPAKATGKAATAKTPPAPAGKRTASRATASAKGQTPAKRARAATTAASATKGRVYRRTPDDLAAVFARVETVVGVAEHYQVPRYTAQGWVSRLRATSR
jgi:hypothetical protein